MAKWTEGRPEKTKQFINDLNSLKGQIFQHLDELKTKRAELTQELKEKEEELKEKEQDG